MLKQLKSNLKRYPRLVAIRRRWRTQLQDAFDIYDSLFSLWSFPPRGVRLATPYGFKFHAGTSPIYGEMLAGRFESEEIALIKSHLTQAQVFVDIGANIGLYTCLACCAGIYTIAVEPQPKNLRLLYTNLIENDYHNVEVYPTGLAERPGLTTLYGASSTGASLVKGWALQVHPQSIQSTIPVTTLDILLGERFAGKKVLIKLDVEGAEYPVLLGASQTLEMRPRPTWMIEICSNEYHPAGLNPNYAATFKTFWRHGYEVRTADSENRIIQPADVERWVNSRACDSGVINYIFTPSG